MKVVVGVVCDDLHAQREADVDLGLAGAPSKSRIKRIIFDSDNPTAFKEACLSFFQKELTRFSGATVAINSMKRRANVDQLKWKFLDGKTLKEMMNSAS